MSLTPRQIIVNTKTFKEATEFQKDIYQRSNMIARVWENYLKAKTLGDVTKVNTYKDMGTKEIEIINELLQTNEN